MQSWPVNRSKLPKQFCYMYKKKSYKHTVHQLIFKVIMRIYKYAPFSISTHCIAYDNPTFAKKIYIYYNPPILKHFIHNANIMLLLKDKSLLFLTKILYTVNKVQFHINNVTFV